ncbi:MAG: DUF6164 family protein [Wenzhouxiangellaceae bacterium]|nr:DUF6164 family protein [Wenzhouxiangellaceae bacterium]
MAKMLINYRGVDGDEIDAIRERLETHGIEFYELPASAFQISAGSLWIRRDEDVERARALFDELQLEWLRQARSNRQSLSFAQHLRRNPRSVLGYIGAAMLVLLVLAWPIVHLLL